MAASSTSLLGSKKNARINQRMIVIRHGERLDAVDYTWTDSAPRPYDPPLTECGIQQAAEAGKRFIGKVKYIMPLSLTFLTYVTYIHPSTEGLPSSQLGEGGGGQGGWGGHRPQKF